MSKEEVGIWEKVVEKGAEKIGKYEKAFLNNEAEEFKKLHREYVDYLERIAEISHISEEALDDCFLNKHLENKKA